MAPRRGVGDRTGGLAGGGVDGLGRTAGDGGAVVTELHGAAVGGRADRGGVGDPLSGRRGVGRRGERGGGGRGHVHALGQRGSAGEEVVVPHVGGRDRVAADGLVGEGAGGEPRRRVDGLGRTAGDVGAVVAELHGAAVGGRANRGAVGDLLAGRRRVGRRGERGGRGGPAERADHDPAVARLHPGAPEGDNGTGGDEPAAAPAAGPVTEEALTGATRV